MILNARVSPPHMLFLLTMLVAFILLIQFGIFGIAFEKLGISSNSAYLLLMTCLLGSMINIPIFTLDTEHNSLSAPPHPLLRGFLHKASEAFHGKTVVAVNLGGCIIPVGFCVYLVVVHPLPLLSVLTAVAIITLISYSFSRPISGLGIGMPIFIAPFSAALMAIVLEPELSAPLAYIGGTLGVVIGADLLRIANIRDMGVPVASIGGAGTFDGIFITGIVAVLLA